MTGRCTSSGIAATSRARCLTSRVLRAKADHVFRAAMRANALRPTRFSYGVLAKIAARGGLPAKVLTAQLEDQSRRLAERPAPRADGLDVLKCRCAAANILSKLYEAAGRPETST